MLGLITKEAATKVKEMMHTLSDKEIGRLDIPQREDKLAKKQVTKNIAIGRDKGHNMPKGSFGGNKKREKSRDTGAAKKLISGKPAQKSEVRMIAGINRGSDNIVKKNDGTVTKLKNTKSDMLTGLQTGGYATQPGNNVEYTSRKSIGKQMFSPLHKKTSNGIERAWTSAAGRRHEAIETKFSGKISGSVKKDKNGNVMMKKRKNGKSGLSDKPMHTGSRKSNIGGTGTFLRDTATPKAIAAASPLMGIDKKGKPKILTGNHHSAGVLAEEAQFTNRMQNRKVAKNLQDMRTETGERDAVHKKIGKDPYGKGRISKSDINKAHKSKKGTVAFDSGYNFLTGKKSPDILQSEGNPNAYKKGKVSGTERIGHKIGENTAKLANSASKLLKRFR